ncbi:MAG TPA: radical SAM protein [Polyangia bacterium]|nr:radical SAM protein [Polyangia bacterium]
MRIVLVHPAGSNWIPGRPDVTTAANRMAPIGILSMAAFLGNGPHEIHVHDCLGPFAPTGHEANALAILALDPDLVGFSTTTSAFLDACDMAGLIKEARPGVRTVFGGVHVSAMGAELLHRFPVIDCLVVGEGEQTLAELAEGRDPASIDGLIWRDGESVAVNPPRQHLPELDDLPFPSYEKLTGFPGRYRLPPFSYVDVPGATLITSRGCVYQCSYCDRSVFHRGFRFNSADYIYEHLRFLSTRFGVRHVNVYDDLFTTNRARIEALCLRLAREPLQLRFNCAVHAGHADDGLLELLRDARCLMISIGIESGDPELLERHKASVTLDQVRDTVRRIQAHGLRAKGLFMMGLPGETPATVERTAAFVLSLGLDDMNMSKFTPFPGAPCWETIRDHGAFDEDWRRMNCLNFVFVPKDFESCDQLDRSYNRFVRSFYTDKKWRRKALSRTWQHRNTLWHMLVNARSFMAARRYFDSNR